MIKKFFSQKNLTKIFVGIFLGFSFFGFSNVARADVLEPYELSGLPITSCGEIEGPGTYILDNSNGAFDATGSCLTIHSSGVTVDIGTNAVSFQGDISANGINPGDDGFDFTIRGYTANTNISSLGNDGGKKGTVTIDAVEFYGNVAGNALFINSSQNSANINGGATFMSSSYNSGGTVSGVGYFYPGTSNDGGVTNAVFLNDSKVWTNESGDGVWSNSANWFGGLLPSSTDDIILSASVTLSEDIPNTNHVFVGVSGITIDGGDNGSGGHWVIDGDVNGDGVGISASGRSFTLQNIAINGDVKSTGQIDDCSSGNCISGGFGGDITITAASILGNVTSIGGSGPNNGGGGGNISITTSTVSGDVFSIGGISTGMGGNGGMINITASSAISGEISSRGGDCDYMAGSSSTINIDNSEVNTISSLGGNGGNYGGNGGTINITSSNLDISNLVISAGSGSGYSSNGTNGGLTLLYTNLTTNSSTIFNNVGSLTINDTINETGFGPWNGVFNPIPAGATITSGSDCAQLFFPTIYQVQSFSGDCHINYPGITLEGSGTATITGDITSSAGSDAVYDVNGYEIISPKAGIDINLSNIIVDGNVTSGNGGGSPWSLTDSGGNGGTINILNNSIVTGTVTSGSGVQVDAPAAGWGGSINILDSETGNIVSGVGGYNLSGDSGSGGVINITSSTVGAVTSGVGSYAGVNYGGSGGDITISNSTTNAITAGDGGTGGANASSGGGGSINIGNSSNILGVVIAGHGANNDYGYWGGNGGSITIADSNISNDITAGDAGAGYGDQYGGAIAISGATPNISGITLTAGQGSTADGSVTLTFSQGLSTNESTYVYTHINNLILNSTSYGHWNGLFNPQNFYFSDQNTDDGDWGNVLNWWNHYEGGIFSEPAGRLPNSLDDVFVNGQIITQDTSGVASAKSIVFNGNSTSTISIITSLGATFNDHSTNAGAIVGATTFNGDNSNNNGYLNLPPYGEAHDTFGSIYSVTMSASGRYLAGTTYQGGIWVSDDYGQTWHQSDAQFDSWLHITSDATGQYLAATTDGNSIWKSDDYGETWQIVPNGGYFWTGISYSADGGRLLAVSCGFECTYLEGVRISTDHGATWTIGIAQQNWSSVASNNGGLLTAVVNGSDGIWESSDGENWVPFSVTGLASYDWVSVTSNDSGTRRAAITGSGTVVTSDENQFWNYAYDFGFNNIHTIKSNADGSVLVVASNSGVYRSTNFGVSWQIVPGTEDGLWTSATLNSTGEMIVASNASGVWITNLNNNEAPVSRVYTQSATTTRNFTTEGGRDNWVIIAQRAVNSMADVVVNLAGATYDLTKNIFKAFLGASFISGTDINNDSSHVVPEVSVSFGTAGTNGDIVKWHPVIDWDGASTCEYSYDDWANTYTLDCSQNGTDLPRPSAGQNLTLSFRATNPHNSFKEYQFAFTYDDSVPIFTSCGSDILDEVNRPYYYLATSTTESCTATVDTKLYGNASTTDSVISGAGFMVNGDVEANGNTIVLKNIIVTGATHATGKNITLYNATTTSVVADSPFASGGNISIFNSHTSFVRTNGASGGDGGNVTVSTSITTDITSNGANGENGGSAGNITIATSTTGEITANGADGSANGGNGGIISITNSIGVNGSSTPITANGGSSTSCGNGGDSGIVTLRNSTYATPTANPGNSENSGCQNETHSSGTHHAPDVTGSYSSGENTNDNNNDNNNNTPPPTPSAPSPNSRSVSNPSIYYQDNKLHTLSLDLNLPSKLKLTPLPTFGEGKNSFNFNSLIQNFLSKPLPKEVTRDLKIKSILDSFNISSLQSLASLVNTPLLLKEKDLETDGLYTVTNASSTPLRTYLGGDIKYKLVELVKTTTKTPLTITLASKKATEGKWNNSSLTFKKKNATEITATITTPEKAGRYLLTNPASPITLAIEVVEPSPPPKVEKWSVWKWVKGIFK